MENEIETMRTNLWQKISDKKNSSSYSLKDDNEFYFLAGQVVYYLKSKDKRTLRHNQDISNFLRCKTSKDLKAEIIRFYSLVSSSIPIKNYRFNNAYNLVLACTQNFNLNENFFIIGFLTSNLLYISKIN